MLRANTHFTRLFAADYSTTAMTLDFNAMAAQRTPLFNANIYYYERRRRSFRLPSLESFVDIAVRPYGRHEKCRDYIYFAMMPR